MPRREETDTVADSVPLSFDEDDSEKAASADKKRPKMRITNLKMLAAIFLAFITVVSDFFVNNVLAGFGEKAVTRRSATSWGVILQGIFLVLFCIITNYGIEHGVI